VCEGGNAAGDTVSVSNTRIAGTVVPFAVNYTATGGTFRSVYVLTGSGNDVVNVNSLLPASQTGTTILAGAGNDVINVPVSVLANYTFAVIGGAPTGGSVGDVLTVIDVSGGAVIHNTSGGPGSGTIEVLYLSGASSHINYQDIEQVVSNPT